MRTPRLPRAFPFFLQNGNYAGLGNGTTDASGSCVFSVDPGSNAVRAIINSGDGYNFSSVWYEAANRTIEVNMPDFGEVSGTVKLNGMAAGNPLVVLDDGRIFDTTPYNVSQQDGPVIHTFTANRFSFTTTMGDHSVYAIGYSDGTMYRSDPQSINVSADVGQAPIVLELKPAGSNISALPAAVYDRIFHTSDTTPGPVSFSGKLTGADGLPLANVTMVAQDYFLKEPASARTDANGDFAFSSINLGTDIVRFKVSIEDNGTDTQSFSRFYPVQNMTALDVQILDYPKATVGYIYGIIATTDNRSNPVALSGTVYLSNGLVQAVSPDRNNGQFFFTLTPGTYEIYAEHQEGAALLVSDKKVIDVEPEWSVMAINPTLLVVQPEKVQPWPLAGALAAGVILLAGLWFAMRKWL